jgi:hypothetical protein
MVRHSWEIIASDVEVARGRNASSFLATSEFFAMTSSNPTAGEQRRDSALAFSIMFFAGALLCTMLGWAAGVRHNTRIMHIPETGGWLVAAGVFAVVAVLFLIWSRTAGRDVSGTPTRRDL